MIAEIADNQIEAATGGLAPDVPKSTPLTSAPSAPAIGATEMVS
jgi:hypothetical protein